MSTIEQATVGGAKDKSSQEGGEKFPVRIEKTERVPQKDYGTKVAQMLSSISLGKDEQAVVMLRPPLDGFSDDIRTSPIFLFDQSNLAEAKAAIQEWADHISKMSYFLPALTSEYYLGVMSETQFNQLLENPDLATNNEPNTIVAIRKLKEVYASGDKV